MNKKYKFEVDFLTKTEDKTDQTNNRELITNEKINLLKQQYPRIPKDFLDYLQEIGAGTFRESQFRVSSDLFDLEDLRLSEHFDIKKTIKFFGDNFSGDFAGFDFENGDDVVVEFWHESGEIFITHKTFKQYIRQQMLIDENGNDLRVK